MNRFTSILIALCVVLIFLQVRSCQEINFTKKQLELSGEKADFWRDKSNRSNAELAVLQLDKQTFKKYHAELSDSLKELNIKLKNVSGITTITKTITDTVPFVNNQYRDRWSFFKLENNKLSYSIKDSIALVTHHKKHGSLNHKSRYSVRVVSFNPAVQFTGITSTEIRPKQRRVNIGLYSGYGVTLTGKPQFGLQVGIGIQYRIF